MTPVRGAVKSTSPLQSGVRDGLDAMIKTDKQRIHESVRAEFADSLDLDAALAPAYPNDPRWDYLLGHGASGLVVALEPHSATTSEISVVKAKRRHAWDQVREHLHSGARIAAWFWVASGKVDFIAQEKATLQLDQAGVTFVGRRLLARDLRVLSTSKPPRKK